MNDCPCGGGNYVQCCAPLHGGQVQASTAEQLMRSRYSAYAVGQSDYVFRTWHPRTRPQDIEPTGLRWVKLEIVETEDGQPGDQMGTVEFIASYIDQGQPGQMRERSLFEFRRGRWFYLRAS